MPLSKKKCWITLIVLLMLKIWNIRTCNTSIISRFVWRKCLKSIFTKTWQTFSSSQLLQGNLLLYFTFISSYFLKSSTSHFFTNLQNRSFTNERVPTMYMRYLYVIFFTPYNGHTLPHCCSLSATWISFFWY